MKSIVGIVVGCALAFAIACGGGAKKSEMPPPVPGPGPTGARSEIDALDQAITADMTTLGEARPPAPANACVTGCEPQVMSGAAATATATDPTCKPGAGETCTDACKLKDSIC